MQLQKKEINDALLLTATQRDANANAKSSGGSGTPVTDDLILTFHLLLLCAGSP